MAGTATYRGNTADHDHSHAYITDRRHLESQTNEESEWGPIREKFTRNELTAVTPMGTSEAGTNYLAHLWTDDVLKSTDARKETCPFPFISYILPTTRSRGSMSQQPPDQEVQQPPRTMFANYDAESYIAADQTVVSETLIELGFMSKIVTRAPGNPLPRPVQVEDALSMKLPNGTYEKWKPEGNSYPTGSN